MLSSTPATGCAAEGVSLEPAYQVKLLAALRSGDPALIHPFLTEIGKDRRGSVDLSGGGIDTAAAALHLAVRCASIQTVQLLLSHRAISPNGIHPPGSGTTPFHLAASLGRADIVSLLLDQDSVDDTIRDAQGRTCRDLARNKQITKLIDDSRSFLNASYRSLLRSYILSPPSEPPSPALITLLSSPRASLVDLSYLDDSSGSSILHEAAKRKDLRLIELAVRAGADVFLRNRRGKMAMDSAGKDDKVRVFLRQFANHDRSLIQTPAPLTEPPTLKGYLNKYTNVAKGYSTRWFVLANGVLSYYRHQDDENITSRGSISMKNSHFKTSGGGGGNVQYQNPTPNSTSSSSKSLSLRFEIHSLPSTNPSSSSQQQKWYIKANHPTEAARWITAIRASMEWYTKKDNGGTNTPGGSPNLIVAGAGANVAAELEMARRTSRESYSDSRSVYSFVKSKKAQIIGRTPMTPPIISVSVSNAGGGDAESINVAGALDPNLSDVSVFPGIGGGAEGEGDEDEDMETSSADTGIKGQAQMPPYEVEYEIAANSVVVQLEAVHQLVAGYLGSTAMSRSGLVSGVGSSSLVSQTSAPTPAIAPSAQVLQAPAMTLSISSSRSMTSSSGVSVSSSSKSASAPSHLAPPPTTTSPLLAPPTTASPLLSPLPSSSLTRTTQHPHSSLILTSLSQLSTLLTTHLDITSTREEWYKRKLKSERKRQSVWEESLRTVVREGEILENELKERRRRRGSTGVSEFGDMGGGSVGVSMGGRRRRETIKAMGRSGVGGGVPVEEAVVLEDENENSGQMAGSPIPQAMSFVPPSPQQHTTREGTMDTIRVTSQSPIPLPQPLRPQVRFGGVEEEEEEYDDSEDEFFDAIESNNLPGLIIPAPLSKPLSSPAYLPPYICTAQYSGYKQLRTRLEIDDERPPTSLWSVLKHSIGKDLTRISFPVFFNEPSSMLQRMAEDMEFSECLDTAAMQKDSLKRLAYVAAFAMSNYSSTIGRIAKPFNPMLSETFEYVRLDKKYRYVSEQVSHHPPISACWAESPLWHYFGEVDAQNKFMGKSFEIRPTGVAHAELRIPESWVTSEGQYPKSQGRLGEGKVVEHYTWKKVTTNVSGFILGSPTIDHYGDMIITNHRTNERCRLTFKPRGWRGKDAYEISGQVMSATGRTVYEIAGRWNSQLIMREVGEGHVYDLNPDTTVSLPSPTNSIRTPGSSAIHHPHSRRQSYPHTHGEYILLWKNSTKPPGSPFNLTPFAISLNDCPPSNLRPYLPPSDCRLRPDQRAFELGKYDLANNLKLDQEEKQRKTRRERELGLREGHKPRWFESRTCGDTGERVWMPKRARVRMRVGEDESEGNDDVQDFGEGKGEEDVIEEDRVEYWVERERVWNEVEDAKGENGEKESGKVGWKDIDKIFVDGPEVIRELGLT